MSRQMTTETAEREVGSSQESGSLMYSRNRKTSPVAASVPDRGKARIRGVQIGFNGEEFCSLEIQSLRI